MDSIIVQAQEAFRKAGYQWQECVFNDGNPRDCSVRLTKSTDPCAFGCGYPEPTDTVGWGRYPRAEAWSMALAWLRKEGNNDTQV